MRKHKLIKYILISIYLMSISTFCFSSEKDEVLNYFENTLQESPECRVIKEQIYTSILNDGDYKTTIKILKRGINLEFYNDHYCMMPLSIVAHGYLSKIDEDTNIKVDSEAKQFYATSFRRIGPNLGKYYYSDKTLLKILPKLRLPESFIDTKRFSNY